MNSPTRCVASLLACWVAATTSPAQVITDGTVGGAGAIGKVGSDFPIPHTLGTRNGGNLFHSFTRFDLVSGESATFTGPGDVARVLARVTGPNASSIDGTLRSTIPGAHVYFINPRGVIFGANAKLEIDGSFTATTANHLKLADGGRFDATDPGADSLTSAPVSAFGFLNGPPGAITSTSSTLAVPEGRTLSLVGGDVSLDRATLTAPSGRLNLWTSRAAGDVAAASGAGAKTGTLRMVRTRADTTGAPSGTVSIRGGRLVMNRSNVTAENTGAGAGGNVDVQITDDVSLQFGSRLFTSTRAAGSAGDVTVRSGSLQLQTDSVVASQATAGTTAAARAGDLRITAGTVSASDGSTISASTFGLGAGGLVNVEADTLSLVGNPGGGTTAGIFSNTNATGSGGTGGGVKVKAETVRLLAGGAISADTFGLGKGGDVEVTARDIFIAARGSPFKTGIFADSGGVPNLISPGGAGGSIRVRADRLQITDGGLVSTKSVGLGSGGDTTIDVKQLIISKAGSDLITGIAVDAAAGPGTGGNLFIKADQIRVSDGGRISANAGDSGPGGDISIRARSIVLTGTPDDPSTISAESTSFGAGGPAGTVEIVTDTLQITAGARLSAATFGGGAGGDVIVRARSAYLSPNGTDVFTGIAALSISTTEAGEGGNVRAEFGDLVIDGRGTIAANTLGPGAGGDVSVTAGNLRLAAGGRISADTSGLGAGGSVVVRAGNLRIAGRTGENASGIFSGSSAIDEGGPGGRVQVQADTLRLSDSGAIAATSSSSGAGGSVAVRARTLTLDTGASIAASATGQGVAGSVSIEVQEPLILNGGSAVRTTSTVSSAGTVAITSATDILLTDSTVAVSALAANAGQVSLRAPRTISLRNSSIVAEAGLNGGNVFIDPEFVLLDRSRISANAILGAGGNILIIANSFLASSSAVTASSEASVPGNVQIQSLIVDLSGALVPLSSSVLDASTRLQEQCARRLGLDFSSFLVIGRGGTEQTPEDPAPGGGR